MRLLGSNILSSAREQHHRRMKYDTTANTNNSIDNRIATSIPITSGVENILNGSYSFGGSYGRGGTIICNNMNDDIVAVYHHDGVDDDDDEKKKKLNSRPTKKAATILKNRDVDNVIPPLDDDGRYRFKSWRRSKKNLTLNEEGKNDNKEEEGLKVDVEATFERGRRATTSKSSSNASASNSQEIQTEPEESGDALAIDDDLLQGKGQDDSTVCVEVEATVRGGTATSDNNDGQGEEKDVPTEIEAKDNKNDNGDAGIISGVDGAVEVTDVFERTDGICGSENVSSSRSQQRRESLHGNTKAIFASIKSFIDDANCYQRKVEKIIVDSSCNSCSSTPFIADDDEMQFYNNTSDGDDDNIVEVGYEYYGSANRQRSSIVEESVTTANNKSSVDKKSKVEVDEEAAIETFANVEVEYVAAATTTNIKSSAGKMSTVAAAEGATNEISGTATTMPTAAPNNERQMSAGTSRSVVDGGVELLRITNDDSIPMEKGENKFFLDDNQKKDIESELSPSGCTTVGKTATAANGMAMPASASSQNKERRLSTGSFRSVANDDSNIEKDDIEIFLDYNEKKDTETELSGVKESIEDDYNNEAKLDTNDEGSPFPGLLEVPSLLTIVGVENPEEVENFKKIKSTEFVTVDDILEEEDEEENVEMETIGKGANLLVEQPQKQKRKERQQRPPTVITYLNMYDQDEDVKPKGDDSNIVASVVGGRDRIQDENKIKSNGKRERRPLFARGRSKTVRNRNTNAVTSRNVLENVKAESIGNGTSERKATLVVEPAPTEQLEKRTKTTKVETIGIGATLLVEAQQADDIDYGNNGYLYIGEEKKEEGVCTIINGDAKSKIRVTVRPTNTGNNNTLGPDDTSDDGTCERAAMRYVKNDVATPIRKGLKKFVKHNYNVMKWFIKNKILDDSSMGSVGCFMSARGVVSGDLDSVDIEVTLNDKNKKDTTYKMIGDGEYYFCAPCQPTTGLPGCGGGDILVDNENGSLSTGPERKVDDHHEDMSEGEGSGAFGLFADRPPKPQLAASDDNFTINDMIQHRLLSEVNKIISTHNGSVDTTMKIIKERLLEGAKHIRPMLNIPTPTTATTNETTTPESFGHQEITTIKEENEEDDNRTVDTSKTDGVWYNIGCNPMLLNEATDDLFDQFNCIVVTL